MDFLSAGPWNYDQSAFYPEDEGEAMKMLDSHFYNGFRIGDVLPKERYGRLTNLEFVEWSNWKSFVLQEGSTRFSVEISDDEILIRTE